MNPAHRRSLAAAGRLLDRVATSPDVRKFEWFKKGPASVALRLQLTVDLDEIDIHVDPVSEQRVVLTVDPGLSENSGPKFGLQQPTLDNSAEQSIIKALTALLKELETVFGGDEPEKVGAHTILAARDDTLGRFLTEVRTLHR